MHIESYDDFVGDLRTVAETREVESVGDAAVCEWTAISLAKAVKNEAEVAGMRAGHVRDGVAFSLFLCWVPDFVRDETTILRG